jgi:hypothetical protein
MSRVLDDGHALPGRPAAAVDSAEVAAEPSLRDAAATTSLVVKLVVAGLLSLAVVAFVPRTVSASGDIPPVGMLLTTATIVAAICGVLLFWGLRADVGLPTTVAVYAVAFNVLVIVVKLVLGPRGYYEADQTRQLDSTFAISDGTMAAFAAIFIFALYAIAYLVLYRVFRKKVAHLAPDDRFTMRVTGRKTVVTVIVLTVLIVASGGALLLVLFPLLAGLDYLDFVFSSSLSLLIAVMLAAATAFAATAFNSAAERSRAVGDVTVFVSFFWVGLYFLALYHVLWVVYVLVLTAIWPLKVVTPK